MYRNLGALARIAKGEQGVKMGGAGTMLDRATLSAPRPASTSSTYSILVVMLRSGRDEVLQSPSALVGVVSEHQQESYKVTSLIKVMLNELFKKAA